MPEVKSVEGIKQRQDSRFGALPARMLKGIPAQALAEFFAMGKESRFDRGEVIGRTKKGIMAFILQGNVKVALRSCHGREIILYTLGPGDLFGEDSLFPLSSASRTVVALKPSRCLLVRRALFLDFLQRYPLALVRMLKEMNARLHKMEVLVRRLFLADAYEKVASVLVDLMGRQNGSVQRGRPLKLDAMSRREWASMAGLSREAFARTISAFQKAGVIRAEGRTIFILNPKRLKLEATQSERRDLDHKLFSRLDKESPALL